MDGELGGKRRSTLRHAADDPSGALASVACDGS
jgi:hypothetical protein